MPRPMDVDSGVSAFFRAASSAGATEPPASGVRRRAALRVRVHGREWIEIDLEARAADAEERQASERHVRSLLWAAACDAEAARTIARIHTSLRGPCSSPASSRGGAPPSRAHIEDLGSELLMAARAGLLVARSVRWRSVAVPLDEAAEEAPLGPESATGLYEEKSWIGIVLVDQDGTPVPGRPYRVILPDGSTQDGTLDAHGAAMITGLKPGNCRIQCPYVEPRAETTYTVQPGEHASGIAERFGFDDYTTVWGDGANGDLAAERQDPHVLQPGDSLSIAELQATPLADRPTGAKHRFQIKRSPHKVRIKLLDLAAKPAAGQSVTLDGAALTSDGDGLVESSVDKSKTALAMQWSGHDLDLSPGDLNQADDATDSGYKARLYNLGFLWSLSATEGDDEMRIALEDFQEQYSLPLTRELDDATKAQLSQAYGS